MERQHNLDAERALLASIFVNPSIFPEIEEALSINDFYSEKHQTLFDACQKVRQLGDPIDFVTVATILKQEKVLEKAGGQDYLAELVDCIVTSAAYKTYIREIKEARQVYNLLTLSDTIKSQLKSNVPIYDILSNLKDFIVSNNSTKPPQTPLSQNVYDYVFDSSGPFCLHDVYTFLQLSTRNDKKNVSIILKRLCEKGMIEKTNRKAGEFRRVDTDVEEIDFINVCQKKMDLVLPLGAHRWVTFYPKQLIVYAGSPDAGKTALLLNFIELNQSHHKITYMSSEMGAAELQSRLILFDVPLDSWKFRAIERATNFVDVVDPDGINVIDFLEIGEDFYKVGSMLSEIFAKLRSGVAIVALQKDPKKEYAKGGYMSLEKPRLYMTVDNAYPGHVLKIVKAKNWRDPLMNPNGMQMRFKIVNGCKLLPQGTWEM